MQKMENKVVKNVTEDFIIQEKNSLINAFSLSVVVNTELVIEVSIVVAMVLTVVKNAMLDTIFRTIVAILMFACAKMEFEKWVQIVGETVFKVARSVTKDFILLRSRTDVKKKFVCAHSCDEACCHSKSSNSGIDKLCSIQC